MNYTAGLRHAAIVGPNLVLFALAAASLGILLDLLSVREARNRPAGQGRAVGLPLVPWMLYFLTAFFLFLRGYLTGAAVSLILLTVWHIAVRMDIARRQP